MLIVTGVTGQTGRSFLNRMMQEKYPGKIKCLVREESDTKFLDETGLDIVKAFGSLEDESFLAENMKDAEVVLHIASVLLSEKVMAAAIQNKVPWAILVHTTGRYSKYKSASEEYINIEDGLLQQRDQIGITVLRPTMIYGSFRDRNMFKLIDYLYRHKFFPMFGKGENLMQPVHANDLGNAYYDVLTNKEITFNKEYNLSGKAPIKYVDVVKCIIQYLGKKTKLVHLPIGISIFGAKVMNFVLRKKAIISVEQVLRMQEDKNFSHEEAAKDFGYSPISFEDGIKGEVEEYLQRSDRL